MEKEKLLVLIYDLKKHFNNDEVSDFLSRLIDCKYCPFRKDCLKKFGHNGDLIGTCQDYFLDVVKGVKLNNYDERFEDFARKSFNLENCYVDLSKENKNGKCSD